jgi:glycosyltransferase involved in cell wall biosynthesis
MLALSVVIPVYRGEETLPEVIAEIAPLVQEQSTPNGLAFRVSEVLLVWDRGPGSSDDVIRELAKRYDWVQPVWLSRNFGQHAATLAGMTSASGDWIVTLDEDGQHDPAYIGNMLDTAFETESQLVYASPTNAPPHGWLRNSASRSTKWLFSKVLATTDFETFHSYRLILGEIGRSAAAYTGNGVYLDVALSWVVARMTTCPVPMRSEGRDSSGYSLRTLFSHFGRLVVSSGTRPLTFVSGLGLLFLVVGILYSIWVLFRQFTVGVVAEGWTSTFVGILVVGGLTLFSLGIIAQYLRATTDASLGRPLYVVVRDPKTAFDLEK